MIQKIGGSEHFENKGKKRRKSRKTRRGYRSIKFSYGHQVAKEKSRSCSAASQTQRKWSQQEKRTIMDQFITIIDQCTVRSTVSIKVYFCSILKTCFFFSFFFNTYFYKTTSIYFTHLFNNRAFIHNYYIITFFWSKCTYLNTFSILPYFVLNNASALRGRKRLESSQMCINKGRSHSKKTTQQKEQHNNSESHQDQQREIILEQFERVEKKNPFVAVVAP